MPNAERPITIALKRGRAELDASAGVLTFIDSAGRAYYQFKLAAGIDCVDRPSDVSSLTLAESDGKSRFVFHAREGVIDKRIHLQVRDGFIDYWVVAESAEPDVRVIAAHYGQDGPGHASASEHSLEEFFIFCPDRYGTCIPARAKVNLKLGVPAYGYDKDSEFAHDGGRSIIAPYFAALRAGDEWLGVGTMEIPTCPWGLNMTLQDGRARMDFDYGGNLTLSEPFAFPRITFFTDDDKFAVGRAYIDRLYADGLAVPNDQWHPDWAGPIYCFFSDQIYEYQTDRANNEILSEMGIAANYCNEAFLAECLAFLATHAIDCRTVILDYGWFVTNGQWQPNTRQFKDLRTIIKNIQAKGYKVLLWYSPYFMAAESSNYLACPEAAVRGGDGALMSTIRLKTEVNYQRDYTHPMTRELCRKDFQFMLGADGLNADGLKIDNTQRVPPADCRLHDPTWGAGEMFHYKAIKFMYETAKAIKPDCCINATAGNPLFNGTFDLHRIHDAQEYNIDQYEERAWAAWFCRAGISDLDDWSSYDLFTVRSNLRKIAYGVPSLYAARKRGCQRRHGSVYGHSVTVRDDELNLISGLYDLYHEAPIDSSQEVFIDPFDKIFWRKYTTGALKGFYAAVTLCGNQAVAVYDADRADVISIADVALAVPLPPGVAKVSVAMVDREGELKPVETFEHIGDQVIFKSRRCCGEIKCYRIGYTIGEGR